MTSAHCEHGGHPDQSHSGSLSQPLPQGRRTEIPVAKIARDAMVTLSAYDIDAGWPPKVKARRDWVPVIPPPIAPHFNVQAQRRYLAAALRHPEVKALLCGRWEVLGCHRVHQKDHEPREFRARVCFFNYSDNVLIAVYVQDEIVQSIEKQPAHMHPESPIEMAQAIAIAKANPEIQKKAEGLVAHAILQMPDPNSPYKGHRCVRVVFTQEADPHTEVPALFSALVDLNLQHVITSGKCSCSHEERQS